MGRPWIEFVQSQRLPWERGLLDALRPGIETKLLSRDPQSGGCSLLVRYPAGFSSSGGALRADDEFLVLDGALDDFIAGRIRFTEMADAVGAVLDILTARAGFTTSPGDLATVLDWDQQARQQAAGWAARNGKR